jgi:hypothetical protein
VKTCGDQTPIGNAKEFIYGVNLAASNSATFTVNGTGFDPYIALMAGTDCNSLDTCSTNNAENLGSAGQDIAIGPTNNASAGQYWIVITDPTNANNCGPFNLTLTGTLPVKLESFNVE